MSSRFKENKWVLIPVLGLPMIASYFGWEILRIRAMTKIELVVFWCFYAVSFVLSWYYMIQPKEYYHWGE